ncbi:MAG: phenylalanine--tRNA ligase subunit beta [Candidatus Thorarchaeota archaeon]|nr:MAG: phenylalanine--tRNA ligase subunit beta [Candidatus Thorarchaeota archaeon]
MIVECRIDDLVALIGEKMSLNKLEETLFLLKAEVETVEGNVIEIEVNPDRQDMLSTEGIARAVTSFLGIETGLRKYPVKKSGKQINVKSGLGRIRPFISCSIVKGVRSDDELIKEYMHLQEALTTTHGRNRSKASIGLYVCDDIDFPIAYGPKEPKKIKFVPLGDDVEMDGPTILTDHEKGVQYGSIIKSHKKWPLLYDSSGLVLSLPPIINSNDLGRITTETKNLFVEVTGTHLPTVDQTLNIMTASLADRGGRIESVSVVYPDGSIDETPDFAPELMTMSIHKINAMTGLGLSGSEIVAALEKMGFGARQLKTEKVQVQIPRYRVDILHPVDVIEDIAIGYGFDRIEPAMPQTMTTGKAHPVTRLRNKVRDLMVGVGYQEVMNYIMSSPDLLRDKMLRSRPVVTTGNPKSRDYSVLRNSLLPVLLDFAAQNQHADYPQKLFEVGDIAVPDELMETRIQQIPTVSGVVVDTSVNITELATDIGFLLRNLGLDGVFSYSEREDATFIMGRAADILKSEEPIGMFGEIAPEVLTNLDLKMPVVAFEIYLPRTGEW